MNKRLLIWCVFTVLCASAPIPLLAQDQIPVASPADGQQPPPAQVPPTMTPPAPLPQGQGRQTPPPTAAMVPPQVQGPGWSNIKLDIAILDSVTSAAQSRKVLSMFVADGRQSQMRTQSDTGLINIDVRPQVQARDGRIMLQLTLEYRQGAGGSQFSQSLVAMVVDGKPMVLSQAADASNDRKVSVEVTATVQKN